MHAAQRGDEIGHLGGVEHVVRSPRDFNHLRKDIGWILNGFGGAHAPRNQGVTHGKHMHQSSYVQVVEPLKKMTSRIPAVNGS